MYADGISVQITGNNLIHLIGTPNVELELTYIVSQIAKDQYSKHQYQIY